MAILVRTCCSPPKTLKDQLQHAIVKQISTPQKRPYVYNIRKTIEQELQTLKNFGGRGVNLEMVYNFLLTIPPSVAPQRAFSAAQNVCSKLRSRMNDETLNVLCFLKFYFLNQSRND